MVSRQPRSSHSPTWSDPTPAGCRSSQSGSRLSPIRSMQIPFGPTPCAPIPSGRIRWPKRHDSIGSTPWPAWTRWIRALTRPRKTIPRFREVIRNPGSRSRVSRTPVLRSRASRSQASRSPLTRGLGSSPLLPATRYLRSKPRLQRTLLPPGHGPVAAVGRFGARFGLLSRTARLIDQTTVRRGTTPALSERRGNRCCTAVRSL